jgi:hypothetical protein
MGERDAVHGDSLLTIREFRTVPGDVMRVFAFGAAEHAVPAFIGANVTSGLGLGVDQPGGSGSGGQDEPKPLRGAG